MSILINKSSRIVVQGITGRSGLFHTQQCRAYGSNIVAGVTPGKGGIHIEGIPVFNTVAEAVYPRSAPIKYQLALAYLDKGQMAPAERSEERRVGKEC